MTESVNLIGLSGYAQSGKDTVASILAETGWVRMAFADPMREALYALDPIVQPRPGWTVRLLVDACGWDRAKVEYPEVRRLLQRMGTEAGRDIHGDGVWVDAAMRRIDPAVKTVFTDVRFPNEAAAITAAGGKVYRITRIGTGPVNSHATETAMDGYDFDGVIHNHGTVDDLYEAAAFLRDS